MHNKPRLNIVLVEPEIPPNTGNIARLAAATRCHLILLGPLGFELSDRYLKRAGLDYWQHVSWEHLPNPDGFFQALPAQSFHLFTTKSPRPYTQAPITQGDYLVFGRETAGLPAELLQAYPQQCYTLPMWQPEVRSINLSSAVAAVTYDALRRIVGY